MVKSDSRPELAISTSGLRRTFRTRSGEVEAVAGVDLEVRSGEIVGFLGPNGAGKTTVQRVLVTLLRPTGGTARVTGRDVTADPVAVRRRIGYVAQGGGTEPEATVGEELVDHGRLYGLSAADAAARGRELLSELELVDVWGRPTKTLSGGQRRRLDIALGLVHTPGLVFLDEPTSGLDPQARANLWRHIRRLRDERATTVFLTTHYLDEADALCDRILVIDAGRIVAEGTPEALKRQVSGDAVRLGFADEAAARDAAAVVGASRVAADGRWVALTVPRAADALPEMFRRLDAAGLDLRGVEVRRPTLDDVFLSLTGRALRDDVATSEAVAA